MTSIDPDYRSQIGTYTQLRTYDELIQEGASPVEAFHVAETMCIDYDGEEGYLGDIIPDGQQPPFPFDGRRPK